MNEIFDFGETKEASDFIRKLNSARRTFFLLDIPYIDYYGYEKIGKRYDAQ